ncbi:hypothetical protein [Sphingobium sp.]|uniref:hypothetical protein n=1 Tax=Sphingobium sp. TaxID=1912891 RepID=UPI0028BEA14B|nr:hypothetical protein [Sphingobium sp.]
MRKLFILIGVALAPMSQAHAAEPAAPSVKPIVEDAEIVVDGLAFTTLHRDTDLAGFELEFDTSVVREFRPLSDTSSVISSSSFGLLGLSANTQPARLTDTQFSIRRSVALTKNLLVDMLVRAELPTGDVRAGLGRGRSELMADLGIRGELKSVSLWVGGARRFNNATQWTPGRDVNEIYAGWNARINTNEDVRMDFVSTNKRSPTLPREWRISLEYSNALDEFVRVALYAAQDVGPWGKDLNAGFILRAKL